MKVAFYLLLFCLTVTNSFGEVSISIDPPSPIAGEPFEVIFTITSRESVEPFISFDPYGVEVSGRQMLAPSIQTKYYNGKISTQRIYRYVYEMVSDRPRVARLNNISVELGSKTENHKNIMIKILKTQPVAKNIFVQAEVDNESPYLGEGVFVKYYLYASIPVRDPEIKAFPKLNGFIKRFKNVRSSVETVRVGGKIYKRALQYAAKLYPEKTGRLKVDPLKLIIKYQKGNSNPFSSFGLALGRLREKTISSKSVEINVKPLPVENLPPNFMGLVGVHEAKISVNKSKFIINEPIEVRLEISGPGSLEKITAPELYNSDSLESFDVKSTFEEVDTSFSRKTFDYTFLARGDASIPERQLKIYYFNPGTNAYEFSEIVVPAITIGGGGPITPGVATKKNIKRPEGGKKPLQAIDLSQKINAPLFSSDLLNTRGTDYSKTLYLLCFILLLVVLELVRFKLAGSLDNSDASALVKKLSKQGINYGDLSRLIFLLPRSSDDPKEVIRSSQLNDKDKKYFLSCIKELETHNFSSGTNKTLKSISFSKRAFQALENETKNANI